LSDAGAEQTYLPEAKVWHYVPQSRCTPEWVLSRKYREGIQVGLSIDERSLKLLGIPGWLYKFFIRAGGCVAELMKGESPDVFDVLVDLYHHTGVLAGFFWRKVRSGTKIPSHKG
jgi:hypothetical protein